MKTNALSVFLCILLLAIPILVVEFERHEKTLKVEETALANAKVYARASHQFRQFYIDVVMPVAKTADIDVVMDVHAQPNSLPLAYTAAIDIGLKTYSPEFGGSYFVSDYPWRDRAPLSEADRTLWNNIKATTASSHLVFEQDDQRWLLYGEPLIFEKSFCVECHENHPSSPKRDWVLGDLRGAEIIRLRLPATSSRLDLEGSGIVTIGILGILACLSALFVQERMRRAEIETQVQNERQQTNKIALLSGGIAHHFNNLLAVILGSAELLELKGNSGKNLNHIMTSVEKAAGLVDKLQSTARTRQASMTRFDLSELIGRKIPQWQLSYPLLEIETSLPEETIVESDSEFMAFIVDELISNASEHANNKIKLKLSADEDQIQLEVSNDYINKPDLKNSEIPFFTTNGPDRAGLGLAAVNGMAEILGGDFKLWADDKAVFARLNISKS